MEKEIKTPYSILSSSFKCVVGRTSDHLKCDRNNLQSSFDVICACQQWL